MSPGRYAVPEIVPSLPRALGSWALTLAAKAHRTRVRKMAEILFGRRALRNPGLAFRFLPSGSLHRISTCSALLRCVLGGLGGCGSQSLRLRGANFVPVSDGFPVPLCTITPEVQPSRART